MKWKVAGLSTEGTRHIKDGSECEDGHKILFYNNTLFALVLDGAGSARHSKTGVTAILNHFEATVKNENNLIARVEKLRNVLLETSIKYECNLKDLATTFLYAEIDSEGITCIQIGDGVIIFGERDIAELKMITLPNNGENTYANVTTFLTSNDYKTKMQINRYRGKIDRLAMCSDGLQYLVLQYTNQECVPVANFFTPIFDFVQKQPSRQQVEKEFLWLLNSPKIINKTDDDKTLLIAVRRDDKKWKRYLN